MSSIEKSSIEKSSIEKSSIKKSSIEKSSIEKSSIKKSKFESRGSIKSAMLHTSLMSFCQICRVLTIYYDDNTDVSELQAKASYNLF